MLFDELVQTTKALKDLQRKSEIKKNKEFQENTDNKYRVLISQLDKFTSTLVYIYGNIDIDANKEILNSTLDILDKLQKSVDSGWAVSEEVSNAETLFKTLQGNMKKEWASKYKIVTSAIVNTLEALKGIEPEKVDQCLQKIQVAANWNLGETNYKTLIAGLDSAELLITGLGLDDEIILFLKKTNSNKATLEDLNEKVLKWIKEENLEKKTRISFVKTR